VKKGVELEGVWRGKRGINANGRERAGERHRQKGLYRKEMRDAESVQKKAALCGKEKGKPCFPRTSKETRVETNSVKGGREKRHEKKGIK